MSTTHNQCKRCNCQLGNLNAEVNNNSNHKDIADTLERTLPPKRSKELKDLLSRSINERHEASNAVRFLNSSFRNDKMSRNGVMRGSLELVLDSASNLKQEETLVTEDNAKAADSLELSSHMDSFILLSASQLHIQDEPKETTSEEPTSNLTAHLDDISERSETITRIMDLLDQRSSLPHPMCEGCAETMVRLLEREVSDAVREREVSLNVGQAAEIITQSAASSKTAPPGLAHTMAPDVAALEQELSQQTDLERTLEETLDTLDNQLDSLCKQMAELERESQELAELENTHYQELNSHEYVLDRCKFEQWALDDRYNRLTSQLTQLQRTNVYNDVFNITVHDGIASINGFRLGGRSSPHSVEWTEINAAWGQALLLLQTVARRLSYDFLGYKLIPMGSFSRIERTSSPTNNSATFELFGSGDMYLGRLFQNRRFDGAMVAYLACLDQIAQLIMSLSPQLRLPYKIEQDRVGGISIKPQFGQDDTWTKACKNTLLDARWALAYASSYTTPASTDVE